MPTLCASAFNIVEEVLLDISVTNMALHWVFDILGRDETCRLQFFRGADTGNRSVLANDIKFTSHGGVDFQLTGWTGGLLLHCRGFCQQCLTAASLPFSLLFHPLAHIQTASILGSFDLFQFSCRMRVMYC